MLPPRPTPPAFPGLQLLPGQHMDPSAGPSFIPMMAEAEVHASNSGSGEAMGALYDADANEYAGFN